MLQPGSGNQAGVKALFGRFDPSPSGLTLRINTKVVKYGKDQLAEKKEEPTPKEAAPKKEKKETPKEAPKEKPVEPEEKKPEPKKETQEKQPVEKKKESPSKEE